MINEIREQYNRDFSEIKYREFLDDLNRKHPGEIDFRIAETPVFIPKNFKREMLETCEDIVDIITRPDFKKLTERSIPKNGYVPGENEHTNFIAFDFGICENQDGELEPQLIEMQGFPTLFGFQVYYPEIIEKHFTIPPTFSNYLNGYNKESYLRLLKKIILGNHSPENVILLEIKPEQQKTRIDFLCTQDYLGIPIVCLTDLMQVDNKLFYKKDGKKIEIKRIYNRIIFDELMRMKDHLGNVVDITKPLDIEWVPHPNWFYRISKYLMPFIRHSYVPKTYFFK